MKNSNDNVSYSGVMSVSDVADKAGPSIVGIRMTVTLPDRVFFEGPGESKAEGSGVIISENGYIMTNYHVVQYADPEQDSSKVTTLEVFLPDGRQARAEFIGGDKRSDLAVIKTNIKNLPVAELGASSKLKVGNPAVAIGNPLGLEFAGSVTFGVISALNRVLAIENRSMTLIQTDAAINPGNSGGALVNSEGKVIGINSVKITLEGVEGLGFAIPINDAMPIINELIEVGCVRGRPYIGISGQIITEAMAKYYNVPTGYYIRRVVPGSGADKADLRKGDILTEVDGKRITNMKNLSSLLGKYKAGDTIDIVIHRRGKDITLELTFSDECNF